MSPSRRVLGDLVEPVAQPDDVIGCGRLGRRVRAGGDGLLRRGHDLTAERRVDDRPGIALGVADGDGAVGEHLQVAAAAVRGECLVVLEVAAECDGVGLLAAPDQGSYGLADAPVHGRPEVRRAQANLGDLAIGTIGNQQRSEQSLLGVDVARRFGRRLGVNAQGREGAGHRTPPR